MRARILMRQEGEAPFIVNALKEVLGVSQVDLETGARRLDIGAIRGLRIMVLVSSCGVG